MRKNRIDDIEKLTQNMDITPTMLENAIEKYNNIAKYFEDKSFRCNIFPIGSFATGTVVRPYYDAKDQDYDLDFICLIDTYMETEEPKDIKYSVKNVLIENDVYKNILSEKEWDKCWTMEYAQVNNYDFNLDIIPAARNKIDEFSLSITDKDNDRYDWIISKPKVFIDWFNEINRPYLQYNREEKKKLLLERYSTFYNSVEEIPESLERSALQRVIQLLK